MQNCDERVKQLYKKIGCIFNNSGFWANIQEDDFAHSTDLNLRDKNKWVSMDAAEIKEIDPQNI